jgi:hypothetical protein
MSETSPAPSLDVTAMSPAPATRFVAGAARQRGAAVLMALFVAALATLIVTGLFWNQFVLLRTIENQQLVSQSRLLLRGALDWARAILREDAARSNYDARTEPWATPLAPTRLDQLGETSALASQATIEGDIDDAQARLNLRNLVGGDGQIVERELAALRRLCALPTSSRSEWPMPLRPRRLRVANSPSRDRSRSCCRAICSRSKASTPTQRPNSRRTSSCSTSRHP